MSGSAKAGTTAERHRCELRMLAGTFVRAPPKRASGELCFLLTKTYMDVGNPETIQKRASRRSLPPRPFAIDLFSVDLLEADFGPARSLP